MMVRSLRKEEKNECDEDLLVGLRPLTGEAKIPESAVQSLDKSRNERG